MQLEIYTSPSCVWCTKLHKLIKMANITEYTEYVVGKDITSEEMRLKFPTELGFPIVIIDDVNVGGVVGCAREFVRRGLVSSKKNE